MKQWRRRKRLEESFVESSWIKKMGRRKRTEFCTIEEEEKYQKKKNTRVCSKVENQKSWFKVENQTFLNLSWKSKNFEILLSVCKPRWDIDQHEFSFQFFSIIVSYLSNSQY